MRINLLCEHKFRFGKTLNPCRKVLSNLEAEEIIQQGDTVLVKGFKQITLKCTRQGCKKKTTIKIKEE